MSAEKEVWPDYLMIRDTGLHDDMGGLGQRIHTTAGAGYKKVKYVRADIAERDAAEIGRLRGEVARLEGVALADELIAGATRSFGGTIAPAEAKGDDRKLAEEGLWLWERQGDAGDKLYVEAIRRLLNTPQPAGGEAVAYITHDANHASSVTVTEAGMALGYGKHACYTTPPAAQVQQEAVEPTIPVVIFGTTYEVPIRVQLHIEHLRMKLDAIGNTKGTHPVQRLLDATEHCLSAADEGVEYGVGRPMLDAMTTLGLMEKVGRGKWAPTDAAEQFVTHARAPHPAAGDKVRELVEKWRAEAAKLREQAAKAQRRGDGTDLELFQSAQDADAFADELEAALAQPQSGGDA